MEAVPTSTPTKHASSRGLAHPSPSDSQRSHQMMKDQVVLRYSPWFVESFLFLEADKDAKTELVEKLAGSWYLAPLAE